MSEIKEYRILGGEKKRGKDYNNLFISRVYE